MLFRKEVAENIRSHQSGQVLLLTGWPVWLTIAVTLLFIATLLLFLIYGNYTRQVNVSGEINSWPHTTDLFAPEEGVIARVFITPGQTVRAGAALYELNVSKTSPSGNLSSTTLAVLENQSVQIDKVLRNIDYNQHVILESLQKQLDQLSIERQKTVAMVDISAEGVNAMRSSMKDYERYRSQGLVTTDQQNNQRYLFYQQMSVWNSLSSQIVQQDMQINSLRSDLVTRAAQFDEQKSRYLLQQADIKRQLAEANVSKTRLITAPAAGHVSSLNITQGQMVAAGDEVVQLVPSTGILFHLVLWLPDDSVPYIKPGEDINIRYTAYPAEKYGQFPGKIISVSSAPVTGSELRKRASIPQSPGKIWFKAVVAVDKEKLQWRGKRLPLVSGMQAQATLFLEKRPLYQWMFYPYYTLKNSISEPVSDKT